MIYKASNGLEIEYEIIRKKNKNIYFRVKEDLKLYVTAPMYLSIKSVEKLIQENEIPILKMYERQEEKSNDVGKFFFLGEKYYIEIKEAVEDVTFIENRVIAPSNDALEAFKAKSIAEIYERELNLCKRCFASLPEFTWKTRLMRTRWGVCNTKKKEITLNTLLIEKEVELIDYVIIHELCHFFEGNHSKDFWELVKSAYPNYKEARKKLKE